MTLHIDSIGGNCPVQAEGTIGGKPFYFRARHEHWSMGIGGEPVCEPEWERVRQWGDGKHAAGWMPEEVARAFIAECAADYLAGKSP